VPTYKQPVQLEESWCDMLTQSQLKDQLLINIELLESVQRRATQLVPGFWKIENEDRLKKMKLPYLTFRRLRGDTIEVYKHLHGIYQYQVDSTKLLLLDTREGITTRGHSLKLQKRECRTTQRANAFGMRVVNFWNSLSKDHHHRHRHRHRHHHHHRHRPLKLNVQII